MGGNGSWAAVRGPGSDPEQKGSCHGAAQVAGQGGSGGKACGLGLARVDGAAGRFGIGALGCFALAPSASDGGRGSARLAGPGAAAPAPARASAQQAPPTAVGEPEDVQICFKTPRQDHFNKLVFPLIDDDYSFVQLVDDQLEPHYRDGDSAQKFEVARVSVSQGEFRCALLGCTDAFPQRCHRCVSV